MSEVFYCTLDDVKGIGVTLEKITQLCREKNDPSDYFNQANFDSCRKAARSLVDSYCMVLYKDKIPFVDVPEIIVTISARLTKYYLYDRKDAMTKAIEKIYDAQLSLLKKISTGIPKLFDDDSGPIEEDDVMFTEKSPEDRAFYASNLQGFLP